MTVEAAVLQVDLRDGVLHAVKNDPSRSNGISLAMADALHAAIAAARDDDEIRALLIDAAGSGFHGSAVMVAEIKADPGDLTHEDFAEIERIGQGLGQALAALDKPVIGIARAGALGGGLELLLRCDFAYCLDNARFKLPEVRFGFVAAWGGTQWGGRMLRYRRAQELLLLGMTFDGREAEESGIVTRSFAKDAALDHHVAAVLEQLRHCSPASYRETKRALRAAWSATLEQGEAIERQAQLDAMASGDFRDGLAAARDRADWDYVAGITRRRSPG